MTDGETHQSAEATHQTPSVKVDPERRFIRRSWFTLSTTREERFFLLLAVFIGLFSGLAVVCFRLAIDWTKIWLLGPAPAPHTLRVLVVPAAVSLLISVIVLHIF